MSIEISQVDKLINDTVILEQVSASIPEEQMTMIIGPNGAGKSTLLSIISRLTPKDSGQVLISGQEIAEWDTQQLAKELAVMTQSNRTNLRLTVEELVEFGRFPYSQNRLTTQDVLIVEDVIKSLNLENIRTAGINQLSGGQRQRAFLGMILAQQTKYLLLDEPLNNLDMRYAVELMQELRTIVTQQQKTVVTVVHDLNYVTNYADYVIAMKDGKIFKEGPVEQVMQSHILSELYSMSIKIEEIRGKIYCLSYG